MITRLDSESAVVFWKSVIFVVLSIAFVTVILAIAPLVNSESSQRDFVSQTALAAGEVPSLNISYQSDAVVTVGDHSYIPISPSLHRSESVWSESFPQTILELIDAFEQDHPELNVTGWELLTHVHGVAHTGTYTSTRVLGIFLDHQPR